MNPEPTGIKRVEQDPNDEGEEGEGEEAAAYNSGSGGGNTTGMGRKLLPERFSGSSNLDYVSFCCPCGNSSAQNFSAARRRILFFRRLLTHPLWKTLIILCSLVSIFGPQVQTLATDSRADSAFDFLFLSVFIIYVIELAIRIDVEPDYFVFQVGWCCTCRNKSQQQQQQQRGESSDSLIPCLDLSRFQIGSFLFWCELISTLAVLYNISFISPWVSQRKEVNIFVDNYNMPTAFQNEKQAAFGISQLGLYVLISRTARVARFIRSTQAMKFSSKVNWYLFLNLFNPSWYLNSFRGGIKGQKPSKVGSASPANLGLVDELDVSHHSNTSSITKIVEWGNSKAQQSRNLSSRLASYFKLKNVNMAERNGLCGKFVRCLGFQGRADESQSRHLAATKIQRAWRSARIRIFDVAEDADAERDFAWNARGSSISNLPKGAGHKPGLVRGQEFGARQSIIGSVFSEMKKHKESQVGSAMRELTGTRVAVSIIIALVFTVLLTYYVNNNTLQVTMVFLYNLTAYEPFADNAIQAARYSSLPNLYQFTFQNGSVGNYTPLNGESLMYLRERETIQITVQRPPGNQTIGLFDNRYESQQTALASLLSTIFIILLWFFGVTAFVGPVMVLVVIPIERMVRLLGMLTLDPLGYQNSSRYRKFRAEESEITKNTKWTKEILRGMETSFLMLTILRIGSLMKVGFGSAGVEIIRNNLEKSQSKNTLLLSEKGLTVSCIFLFCDIRSFTDATECLQEEVFVFTNRIAAVVHSICNSYGGSANKNIGDAFLLSWRLDEDSGPHPGKASRGETFLAKHYQADKALLSVVKICMALHHDDYYIESMSEQARGALLAKISKRKGPVVQMGFGLHAGKAVQGAIGSQRKIDATYVSEAVEKAEFLESSTKQYGVKMLMSDTFHRLLHPNNRRRCRKVDQIMIKDNADDEDDESGETMELLTFDMDIDALWRKTKQAGGSGSVSGKGDGGDSESETERKSHRKQASIQRQQKMKARRLSVRVLGTKPQESFDVDASNEGFVPTPVNPSTNSLKSEEHHHPIEPPQLILPTGPALYNSSVWVSEDMRCIRQLYSDGIFFQKFNAGLNSFYSRDWEHARQCFVTILERFEDGPSRYFLTQIEKNGGKPPRNFQPYGLA